MRRQIDTFQHMMRAKGFVQPATSTASQTKLLFVSPSTTAPPEQVSQPVAKTHEPSFWSAVAE
jgi:hypothetical protein